MPDLPTDTRQPAPKTGDAYATPPGANDATPGAAIRGPFVLVSVERAEVPSGGLGGDWCRYVLSCGTSRITCLRRGTLDEIAAFAATAVEHFNQRSVTGRGMAGAAYVRKSSPPSAAR